MRGLITLCFLLALLPLAVLGHDIYIAYYGGNARPDHAIQLSDVGWLLKIYAPDAHKWLVDNSDKDVWDNYIGPLLEQTALYVALAPFALAAVVTLLVKIVSWRPLKSGKIKTSHKSFTFNDKK